MPPTERRAMRGLAIARPNAGFRAGATLAATAIVGVIVIILDRALMVLVSAEREPMGFATISTTRPKPPRTRRPPAPTTRATTPSVISPSAPPSTALDPQVLSALDCVVRDPKREPRPDCPPPPPLTIERPAP